MTRILKLSTLVLTTFALIGCGGGGSGTASNTTSNNSNTINLVAATVDGATCTISDGNFMPLGASQTRTVAGSVSFTDFTYTGPALIQCTGGSYTDEATATPNTALSTLTAVVNLTQNGNYAVTPLTHMAAQMAMSGLGNINDVLNSHNPNIADQFGLEGIDITTMLPTDLSNNPFTGSDNDKYALILAVISQIGADANPDKTLDTVISETVADMVADAFLGTATITNVQTAVDNLRGNSEFSGSFTTTVADDIKVAVGTSSTDTIKPIIRLNADTIMQKYSGLAYVDTLPAVIDNSGESIIATTTGTVGTDVGAYALTYTARDSSGNVATATRIITITKKPIVVTANPINKIFRETDPELTFRITGLVGSDTLTGALTREAGEAQGDYVISQGSLSAGNNYTITFISANFTILPNSPPAVLNHIGNQQATVGTIFRHTVASNTFHDSDNDSLSITASFNPMGVFTFTNGGFITGTPTTEGTVTVTLSAADGRGGVATFDFDIVVTVATTSGPVPTSYYVSVLPRQVHSALDIRGHDLAMGATWEYSITDTNNLALSATGMVSSTEMLLNNIDITSLADGDLRVLFRLTNANGDGNYFTLGTNKNTVRNKRVALLLFHNENATPTFTTAKMQERLTNNEWSAKAILEAISLDKESFGTVDTFGWYAVGSATFTTTVTNLDTDFWHQNTQVRAAITNGDFNPDNYDIFYAIFDATSAVVRTNGNALPNRVNINIDGTDYGLKHTINIYGDNNRLFDDQCFYQEQIYNNLERCYNNQRGDNYARVDSVLIHEYLHAKGISGHSGTKYCDDMNNPILGVCSTDNFNMFDVLSSSRFYGNSLNSAFRNQVGWGDGTNTLVVDGIKPTDSTTTTHTITLYSINNKNTATTDTFNSVRINFDDYWQSNLWLEYHSAEDIDYALAEQPFSNIVSGLLISQDSSLLDATPPGITYNTPNNRYEPSNPATVATIDPAFSLAPLGVSITNINHQNTPNRISFDLRLTPMIPTRTTPAQIGLIACNVGSCSVAKGSSLVGRYYQFSTSDIGYTSASTAWTIEFVNLPTGITTATTPIQRQYQPPRENTYSGTPHTFVTFMADNTAVIANNAEFTIRICNSEDNTKCQDIIQYLTIK